MSEPFVYYFFSEKAVQLENIGYSFEKRKALPFIEKSAYDILKVENEKLKAELEQMRTARSTILAYDEIRRLELLAEKYRFLLSKFLEQSRENANDWEYVDKGEGYYRWRDEALALLDGEQK